MTASPKISYWLMKSEPFKYSWDTFVRDGRTFWDGVRNAQAANNMKAMRIGDRAFFYHSNEGKEVVGIMEIIGEYQPDPSDPKGRFGMVEVAPIGRLVRPVTLAAIKADPALQQISLIRQSRLSVQALDDISFEKISTMGGGLNDPNLQAG